VFEARRLPVGGLVGPPITPGVVFEDEDGLSGEVERRGEDAFVDPKVVRQAGRLAEVGERAPDRERRARQDGAAQTVPEGGAAGGGDRERRSRERPARPRGERLRLGRLGRGLDLGPEDRVGGARLGQLGEKGGRPVRIVD